LERLVERREVLETQLVGPLLPSLRAHPHARLERAERRPEPLHLGAAIEALATVVVLRTREQNLGRDLLEAIEHAVHAELRGAAGPDRPETRRGQESDQRLGRVGEVTDHAIAAHDPELPQRCLTARDPAQQLAERRAAPGAALGAVDQPQPRWVLLAKP